MTLIDEQASLEVKVHLAEDGVREARGPAELSAAGAVNLPEVVALRAVEEALLFRKKGIDTSPEARIAAKRDLLARLATDDDLTLVSTGGARFVIEDRGPTRRLDEARAVLREATANLEQFKATHREDLIRIREEQEAAAFKEDLESGDKTRVREALGLNRKALVTADLGG